MKTGILSLIILLSLQANSQSLKDALYSGKLRNDSTVRKTDDLSKKIDTTRKKPEPEKPKVVESNNSVAIDSANKLNPTTATATTATAAAATPAAINKDNTKIWKEFMDTIVTILNSEVMGSKQMKKGDYFVIVDYSIDTDGSVNVTNVLPTPESKFLAEQVKERININPPRMNPVPRKAFKRYSFTVSSK